MCACLKKAEHVCFVKSVMYKQTVKMCMRLMACEGIHDIVRTYTGGMNVIPNHIWNVSLNLKGQLGLLTLLTVLDH